MMKQHIISVIAILMATFLFDDAAGGRFISSRDTQIADLKKSLDEAQATIALLTKSNSNEKAKWQETISVLQSNVTRLSRELDDGNLQFNQNLNDFDQKVQNLTAMINYLSVQILPYDFIRDLEAERFVQALTKLQLFRQNETLVTDLISKVHGNQMDKKIPLINRFGRSIPTIELTLLVYKSLAKVTEIPSVASATSIEDLVDLVQSVDREIIHQSGATYTIKTEATEVKNKLLGVIKEMAESVLKSAMSNSDTYSTSSDVSTVSDLMYTIDYDVFFGIITRVVNSVYGRMNPKGILDHIDSYTQIGHTLDGYAAVFYKMDREGADGDDMVDLAFRIQEIKRQTNYDNVPSEVRDRFEELKGEMPKSLSAIAFAPSVCLKNVRYGEYLYAANILEGSDRRRVFTWGPGTEVCEGTWKITRYTTKELSIKNVNFGDYLFYSSVYPGRFNLNVHQLRTFKMFTWTPNGNIVQNKWRFIYSTGSDNVQIMNTNDADLSLMASKESYMDNRRYVEAAAEYNWKEDNNLWKIEDCDYKCK